MRFFTCWGDRTLKCCSFIIVVEIDDIEKHISVQEEKFCERTCQALTKIFCCHEKKKKPKCNEQFVYSDSVRN